MTRSDKVELFEQLRREYQFGDGTIAGVARKFGVHRRMVRQAIANALPPGRKVPVRQAPQLAAVRDYIDAILAADKHAPRKQRHTAHRIYVRLRQDRTECPIAERTVRQYVRDWRQLHGESRLQVFVPQAYTLGGEAQVDWYEAVVELDGQRTKVQFLAMRSMVSGAAFHRAYLHATQQAFLEAQQLAFHYFGGVFRRLRYDNLASAVQKILRGRLREETARFIAFRSHWQYEASFCNPSAGHEKGGVEGEVGYFRRNHLVPVPVFENLAALNDWLLVECRADLARVIGGRNATAGELFVREQGQLLPLPGEDFALAEEQFCRVDKQACVTVRTNRYSTPLRPGTQAHVRVWPTTVEILAAGAVVATHPRSYGRLQQVLELEHYLAVLNVKPGAFAGSQPLEQWRAAGRWTNAHEQAWQGLQQRHGAQAGTRQMIELLQLGQRFGYDELTAALQKAHALGTADAAVVRYLLTAAAQPATAAPLLPAEAWSGEHYSRPLPALTHYDNLLTRAPGVSGVEVRL